MFKPGIYHFFKETSPKIKTGQCFDISKQVLLCTSICFYGAEEIMLFYMYLKKNIVTKICKISISCSNEGKIGASSATGISVCL